MRPLPAEAAVEGGVLYRADEFVAQFVRARMGGEPFRNYCALGLMAGGKLVGGVVFQNWTAWGVEIAIVSDTPRWCRPEVLRRLFEFTFIHLGRARATAKTSADNTHVRRVLERLGCRLEGVQPLDFDGRRDLAVYGMLARDCHWLRMPAR